MSILEFLYRAFETDVSFHVTVTIKHKTHELYAVAWIFWKRASHRRSPQLRFGAASGEDGSPTSPVDQSKCIDLAACFAAAFGGASFWSLPVSSLDRIIWLLRVRRRALPEFSSEDNPPCVFRLAAVG